MNEVVRTRNCGQITTVLFTHNVEIMNEQSQWEKGNMTMVKESNDPIIIRLTITTDEESRLDEILSVHSRFTDSGNTTVNWAAEDVSQGELRKVDMTARFKTKRIREKFTTVWENNQKQMIEHLKNLCECS